MMDYSLLSSPIVAFLIGLAAVRIILRIAPRINFVDKPDLRRKLHEVPVALGGGIAVWIATWVGWSIFSIAFHPADLRASTLPIAPLAVASFLMLVLGVADDRHGMRGIHKLAGQVVAASLMVASGLHIDALSGLGFAVDLGVFAYPITVLWIVLVVNAFNLIDGLDGFCGGVSLVTALALAWMGFRAGRIEDAAIALALAGALVAFLKSNVAPAKIYLGDAGSMTLGLFFSVLTVRASTLGTDAPTSLPTLVALVALPLLDVLTALGRRWLTGHSLFMPDRGHIHHRLRIRLGRTSLAVAVAVVLATIGALGAALSRRWPIGDGLAILAVAAAVSALVGTNTFGASELRLLGFRLKRYLSRFLVGSTGESATVRQECRLHGGREWAGVWDALIRSAEAGDVRQIELAIDMPAAGETYHGIWSLPIASSLTPNWSVIHSLHVRGVLAGEIRVSGSIDTSRDRYLDTVEDLVRILEAHLESDGSHPQAHPPQVHSPNGLTAQGIGRIVLPGTDL